MTIFVELLNEGSQVWRPVEAEQISPDTFKIVSEKTEDEDWRFLSGDIVKCEERKLSDGSHLIAIEKVK